MEFKGYGMSRILKEYANFPQFLDLPCLYEHGCGPEFKYTWQLEEKKPLMLVNSKNNSDLWIKSSKKRVKISGAVFILYRKMKNIRKANNATGTVAFPMHSSDGVQAIYDTDKYCQKLMTLNAEYQPVTVCLHEKDYLPEIIEKYENYGFQVVTAGDMRSDKFPEKFYNILRSFKYSTSNSIGSFSFYSVDLGIPFFIYGELGYFKNINDPFVPSEYDIYFNTESKYFYDLFNTGPVTDITEPQMNFVMEETGINDCLTPKQLNKLFWKYYFIEKINNLLSLPLVLLRIVKQFIYFLLSIILGKAGIKKTIKRLKCFSGN